ncbi:MAG: hypothetical protein AUJ55_11700 [Proteobacteria bacterium CG1_02_64_396]|nr:MAG: hypothetical protein AUJ55_11700 [Proteobacteria bacterium CG1_02_64_396]
MVTQKHSGSTALTQNVGLALQALYRVADRPGHLPGLAVFYGPSGYGKSFAAGHAAGETTAFYVEARNSWSRKAFVEAVANEMGLPTHRLTLPQIVDKVAEQLVVTGRPLIVDEVDQLVDKGQNYVEILRDLYEASGAPILLIGEEMLPQKLQRYERFHGRILDFFPAQPCSLDDALGLRALYCVRAQVGDDLLAAIVAASKGSVRRVCVNLERAQEFAEGHGLDTVTLGDWGSRDFFTGRPPARRV